MKMMNLVLWSTLSNNGGNTSLTTDCSRKGSGGLFSLTFGSRSTKRESISPVGSWRIYEFGGGVSTVSGLRSTSS